MSAYVDSGGTVTALDGKAAPSEVVTAEDAKDPEWLARIIGRILLELADLRRRWWPRRIVFRDVAVTGTSISPVAKQFQHNFGGRVYWWVGDWVTSSTVTHAWKRNTTTSTDDVLGVWFFATGTITVIVEEAG